MTKTIATHAHPVWRHQANFIIMADLSDHGMQGRWEQLWARQLHENEFEMCCIPFFTYGISLGDHVTTGPRDDHRYVIREIGERSGHRVLRLLLDGVSEVGRAEIDTLIEERKLSFEWYSANLLSFDVPGDSETSESIQLFLRQFAERHGALMENGG